MKKKPLPDESEAELRVITHPGGLEEEEREDDSFSPSVIFEGVLLRTPQKCRECKKHFAAIYALGCCKDHEGEEEV